MCGYRKMTFLYKTKFQATTQAIVMILEIVGFQPNTPTMKDNTVVVSAVLKANSAMYRRRLRSGLLVLLKVKLRFIRKLNAVEQHMAAMFDNSMGKWAMDRST